MSRRPDGEQIHGRALLYRRWRAIIDCVVAAIVGTLSPNGQEAGPFSPLEQALLPDTVPARSRTRAFAWYNIFGFLPSALGALAAGAWQRAAHRAGIDDVTSYQWMLGALACEARREIERGRPAAAALEMARCRGPKDRQRIG